MSVDHSLVSSDAPAAADTRATDIQTNENNNKRRRGVMERGGEERWSERETRDQCVCCRLIVSWLCVSPDCVRPDCGHPKGIKVCSPSAHHRIESTVRHTVCGHILFHGFSLVPFSAIEICISFVSIGSDRNQLEFLCWSANTDQNTHKNRTITQQVKRMDASIILSSVL